MKLTTVWDENLEGKPLVGIQTNSAHERVMTCLFQWPYYQVKARALMASRQECPSCSMKVLTLVGKLADKLRVQARNCSTIANYMSCQLFMSVLFQ